MPCFHPQWGGKRKDGSVSMIGAKEGFNIPSLPLGVVSLITLPCGQCIGCRLEYSRNWAIRCMHEASLHAENCFITLTYDDFHLPANGTLVKRDFQLFMKRLRKEFPNARIRYYHCGEYGERFGRPHYHACIFGFDFPDKEYLGERGDFPVFRSATLERLWPFGRSEIGSVTFESAAYVARYIVTKVTGDAAADYYGGRQPEYVTMSRRPGIGRDWVLTNMSEVCANDGVFSRGVFVQPPRYYDSAFEIFRPGEMERMKARRDEARKRVDETTRRLQDREKCTFSRVSLSQRRLS